MKINVSQEGIIEYYGNHVGYVKNNTAVVDMMFRKAEIEEFLTRKNRLMIEWRNNVYDNLLKGVSGEAAAIKNCRIYQLKSNTDMRMRFIGYEELKSKGFSEPNAENYKVVFEGQIGTDNPEEIFDKFNQTDLPDGYIGHPLSISDVIELYDETSSQFHYVDSFGFVKLKAFLEPKNESVTAELTRDEELTVKKQKTDFEAIKEDSEQVKMAAENQAEFIQRPIQDELCEKEEFQVETFSITM